MKNMVRTPLFRLMEELNEMWHTFITVAKIDDEEAIERFQDSKDRAHKILAELSSELSDRIIFPWEKPIRRKDSST